MTQEDRHYCVDQINAVIGMLTSLRDDEKLSWTTLFRGIRLISECLSVMRRMALGEMIKNLSD